MVPRKLIGKNYKVIFSEILQKSSKYNYVKVLGSFKGKQKKKFAEGLKRKNQKFLQRVQ